MSEVSTASEVMTHDYYYYYYFLNPRKNELGKKLLLLHIYCQMSKTSSESCPSKSIRTLRICFEIATHFLFPVNVQTAASQIVLHHSLSLSLGICASFYHMLAILTSSCSEPQLLDTTNRKIHLLIQPPSQPSYMTKTHGKN